MAMKKEYTGKDFRDYFEMWADQVVMRMAEINYTEKKQGRPSEPQALWDKAIRSVDEEWGPELHNSIKNYLGADYEGTINALKNRTRHEQETSGLNKLKETRAMNGPRRIRDNMKLTRIGSTQPGALRRGLNKLREARNNLR